MLWLDVFKAREKVAPDIRMAQVSAEGKLLDKLPSLVTMLLQQAGALLNNGLVEIVAVQVVWVRPKWFFTKLPTALGLVVSAGEPLRVGANGLLVGRWFGPAGNRAAFTERITRAFGPVA